MLKLPFQLKASGVLEEHERSLLTQLPIVSAATESLRMSRITQQVQRSDSGSAHSSAGADVAPTPLTNGRCDSGALNNPHQHSRPTGKALSRVLGPRLETRIHICNCLTSPSIAIPPPRCVQISQNMMLSRMVPYHYLNNATTLTTKLGFPVNVVVR